MVTGPGLAACSWIKTAQCFNLQQGQIAGRHQDEIRLRINNRAGLLQGMGRAKLLSLDGKVRT